MKKIIIITGPRHAGKTTLCESIQALYPNGQWVCLDGMYNLASDADQQQFAEKLYQQMINNFKPDADFLISDGACYSYPWIWAVLLRALQHVYDDFEISGIHLVPEEKNRRIYYAQVKLELGSDPRHNLDRFNSPVHPPPDEERFIELKSSLEAIKHIRSQV